MKDRNTIINTARDIVLLCRQMARRNNKNYQMPPTLVHFVMDRDIDRHLDATGIYFKYIQELNDLFLEQA